MKVALTVWENRISPLFDSAGMLLIADIEKNGRVRKHFEPIEKGLALSRVARLAELGINVLICGGISDFFANLIEARRIKIVPFVAGPVEEVLEAFLAGEVYRKDLRMPGCESEGGESDIV
jgi:predicted Fe-Mo cluster-binding NifX family protein